MHEVSLAFLWHQHQPYYPDDVSGENPMPWVRLHATKDYWGMAMLLRETPEFRCTINLVPSLLVQLLGYVDHAHQDTHLRISRLPADGLTAEDTKYLLDHFFMVHPDQMILPFRRYNELFQQRGMAINSAEQAAKRFSKRDVLDLQCWGNLAWFHPLAFELDANLAEFRKKGQDWTEAEKQWLLDKQMELLKQVVPLHRELQQRGQIELTTTPFYHPILPLLWDKRLARQAMPDVSLPRLAESYPEDGVEHIRRAVAYHEKIFGAKPRGMWPSEGSVCQAMIPAVAQAGLKWIATDEEILSQATNGALTRDNQGYLRNPEMLYRPWRVEEQGQQLQIIFRDHAMSDQIGFNYQRVPAAQAVDDFLGKIEAIGRATQGAAAQRPTLASIILDGENCWEYYPNGGVDFLRGLYRGAQWKQQRIKPVRISDYLEKYPATDKLQNLFAGSWISHNFSIWIGHPECNRAWDLVSQTRRHLLSAAAAATKTPQQLKQAWQELYIAEGSDWFWWFGDSHSSAQDQTFDRLFRVHLQNVYTLLDDPVPTELLESIGGSHRQSRLHTDPTDLLSVKIDGRRTYFEWVNAGHYACESGRGTMSMAEIGRLEGLYFGFDTERLLVRLDARGASAAEALADIDTVRIEFVEPRGYEILIAQPAARQPIVQLYYDNAAVNDSGVDAAADVILEFAVPWKSLRVAEDDSVQFFVELLKAEQAVQRVPLAGAISTSVPSADYELIMWQA